MGSGPMPAHYTVLRVRRNPILYHTILCGAEAMSTIYDGSRMGAYRAICLDAGPQRLAWDRPVVPCHSIVPIGQLHFEYVSGNGTTGECPAATGNQHGMETQVRP